MKILARVLFLIMLPILSVAWAGDKVDNNKLVDLMTAWNEKLDTIENKNEISKVEVNDGKYVIKTPIITYSDESGKDVYLGIMFLKNDDSKKFDYDGKGIKFSKTKNSKFYKNVLVTTNGNYEIELRYRYMQNPGESDEINLWGKNVTIVYY